MSHENEVWGNSAIKEVVDKIKSKNAMLNELKDSDIEFLYRKWSIENFRVYFLIPNFTESDVYIDVFIKWATTAPYQCMLNLSTK